MTIKEWLQQKTESNIEVLIFGFSLFWLGFIIAWQVF